MAASPSRQRHLPLEAGVDEPATRTRPRDRPPDPPHASWLRRGVVAAGGIAVGVGLEQAQGGRPPSPRSGRCPWGLSPPGSPSGQHAWTRDTALEDRTAIRWRRALTGCCSSMWSGTPTPAHTTRAGGGAAHARALVSHGARTGCCSPPAGARDISRTGPGSRVADTASRRDYRTSSCRRSTTTTSACISRATTSSRLARHRSGSGARRSARGRGRARSRSRAALRWRETRTGFVGDGLPAAHQNVGGIPAGRPVAATAPLFMGFKSNLRREPGDRGRRHDLRRPVRRRHDDAGQLHAPAARQLVRRA